MKGVMQTLFMSWRRVPSGAWEAVDPVNPAMRYHIAPVGPGYVLRYCDEPLCDVVAKPEEAAWFASHRALRQMVLAAEYRPDIHESLLAIVRASLPDTPLEEPSPWPNAPLSTNPSTT